MIKTIICISIVFLSLTGFAQKTDSLERVKQQKEVQEIISKTTIQELEQFLYKTMTAEKYNEFVQYYNAFIQRKYNEKNPPKK